jgi:hypothetical protein
MGSIYVLKRGRSEAYGVGIAAYISDLIEDALPSDPQAHVNPIRLATLDANLGPSLMQTTAIIHAELIEAPIPFPRDRMMCSNLFLAKR